MISKLDGCYKNEIRRNFLTDLAFAKRKGPTKFFLKSHKKNIKCQYLSKQLVKMNIKCQIRKLQEIFALNKLCIIDMQNFWPPKFNCCLENIFFSRNLSANNFNRSHTFVYFLTIAVLQNCLISFQVPPSNLLIVQFLYPQIYKYKLESFGRTPLSQHGPFSGVSLSLEQKNG